MEFLSVNGRKVRLNVNRYRIKWDREKEVSVPQARVKQFLRPYWEHDLVCEEAVVPGSRMRVDLWNLSKGIVLEVSPSSTHTQYSPFFHRSIAGFRASLKREILKETWAAKNGYKYVELNDEALANLSVEWLKLHYDIDL